MNGAMKTRKLLIKNRSIIILFSCEEGKDYILQNFLATTPICDNWTKHKKKLDE